jgi:hypothetical protein
VRLLTASLLTVASLVGGAVAAPTAGASGVTCSIVDLPVTGPTGGAATVQGQLCKPSGSTPREVQLLVHGGTYNRAYWDLPVEGYSYQKDMARNGFSTFAVDRPGTGACRC